MMPLTYEDACRRAAEMEGRAILAERQLAEERANVDLLVGLLEEMADRLEATQRALLKAASSPRSRIQ
jgi:hypothetical protein